MNGTPYKHHRHAALALLAERSEKLTHKAAGFLGHCCVQPELTDKQLEWLALLLSRNGLPALAG